MDKLIVYNQLPDVSTLDWNAIIPLAKQLLSGECQMYCFYEAQVLTDAIVSMDIDRVRKACIDFINQHNRYN